MMFSKRRKNLTYTCSCCGEIFSGSPSFGMKRPEVYYRVDDAERDSRIEIDGDDLCLIRVKAGESSEDDFYAIRATLEIPIHGAKDPFVWGVWVSQSKEAFFRYIESVDTDQNGEGSFGWLTVSLAPYKRSTAGNYMENLACDVLWQDAGQRPVIFLHETDHPLYIDQNNGISWERAVEIAQIQLENSHKSR